VHRPESADDLRRAEELELRLVHGSGLGRLTARLRLAADARRAEGAERLAPVRATATEPAPPRPKPAMGDLASSHVMKSRRTKTTARATAAGPEAEAVADLGRPAEPPTAQPGATAQPVAAAQPAPATGRRPARNRPPAGPAPEPALTTAALLRSAQPLVATEAETEQVAAEDVGWQSFAAGFDDAEDRMAKLDADLERTSPRLSHIALRILSR
jgi:hypothetical protein